MSSDTPLQSTVASSEHNIISVPGQKPVIVQFPGVKVKINSLPLHYDKRVWNTVYMFRITALLTGCGCRV